MCLPRFVLRRHAGGRHSACRCVLRVPHWRHRLHEQHNERGLHRYAREHRVTHARGLLRCGGEVGPGLMRLASDFSALNKPWCSRCRCHLASPGRQRRRASDWYGISSPERLRRQIFEFSRFSTVVAYAGREPARFFSQHNSIRLRLNTAAVTVAMKNKMDLAIGVAVGSSTQVTVRR